MPAPGLSLRYSAKSFFTSVSVRLDFAASLSLPSGALSAVGAVGGGCPPEYSVWARAPAVARQSHPTTPATTPKGRRREYLIELLPPCPAAPRGQIRPALVFF